MSEGEREADMLICELRCE